MKKTSLKVLFISEAFLSVFAFCFRCSLKRDMPVVRPPYFTVGRSVEASGVVFMYVDMWRDVLLLDYVSEIVLLAGVCFPIGKGVYRVLHIPEDEAVLLNSREKAPYLICVEILKCETPRYLFCSLYL